MPVHSIPEEVEVCNKLVDGVEVFHVYKGCVALARGHPASYSAEELFKVESLEAAGLDLLQVLIYLADFFENSVGALNPHRVGHPFKVELFNSKYRIVNVFVLVEAAVDAALVCRYASDVPCKEHVHLALG